MYLLRHVEFTLFRLSFILRSLWSVHKRQVSLSLVKLYENTDTAPYFLEADGMHVISGHCNGGDDSDEKWFGSGRTASRAVWVRGPPLY